MILAIANKCTPSPTLLRKREREQRPFSFPLSLKHERECISLFLPLSRLRGRESRVARPVGAFFFREEGK